MSTVSPDAGGVHEPQTQRPHPDGFLHHIPRGTGDVRDDGPVKSPPADSGDWIFPRWALLHNGGGNAPGEEFAP